MASDAEVRQYVYVTTVDRGLPPAAADVAAALGIGAEEVRAAFRRLNAIRLLALAPDTGEIVMAPPFSAVPTPFLVEVEDKRYFANCVWDSLGIPAALHRDATVRASCACCGEPMTIEVRDAAPVPVPAVAHFAVPAARWWEDIVYT